MKINRLSCAIATSLLLLAPFQQSAMAKDFDELEIPASIISEYRELTRRILLALIDVERFNLRYRRDSAKEPKGKRLRYFLAQETGAATGLTYECVIIDQLQVGRRRPLTINKNALDGGLKTVMIGSIIAGAGSGLELASNSLHALKSHKDKIDSQSANNYMSSHINQIDALILERETFLSQYASHPHFRIAAQEGKILRLMRDAVIFEYSQFHKDIRKYRARENMFYALNIATNTLTAVSIQQGILGLKNPDKNGPANILFSIAGAFTMASPLISNATGVVAEKAANRKLKKIFGEKKEFDYDELRTAQAEFAKSLKDIDAKEVTRAVYRAGEYTQSTEASHRLMESETKVMRYLNKVAVENSLFGPVIGGTLLGQGIAGTVGYYKYHPSLKELDLTYKGAVSGCVGTGMAVGLNAVGLVADLLYSRKLSKKNLLPKQIIEERLSHLDQVEKQIKGL
jgi:hypothetical protein